MILSAFCFSSVIALTFVNTKILLVCKELNCVEIEVKFYLAFLNLLPQNLKIYQP